MKMSEKGITILCLIFIQFSYSLCFQCPGYDIPRKFRCDAINNCGDNSDEEGCPGGTFLLFLKNFSMFDFFMYYNLEI